MRILIYGHEPLKTKVTSTLARHGVETSGISDADDALFALESCETAPDLVLIDRKAKDAAIVSRRAKNYGTFPRYSFWVQKRKNGKDWKYLWLMGMCRTSSMAVSL